nr:hypothetical protein [Tanacetum cinerariifolium]
MRTSQASESLVQIHDRLKKLISQLEILGESLSQEDNNLKFLKSLPTEWRTHTLIWWNKTDLEDQSLDDLFNSLKIYEAEVKSSSSASTSTQNIAFVSSQNTDSPNEPFSAVASVSAASAKIPVSALPNVDTLSNVIIYSFFASQSNHLQLDNDSLKGHEGILEKMELLKWGLICQKWSATTVTGNGTLQESADKEPTNYALMAFTSSSSSSSDDEVASCFKACTKAYVTLQSHYDKLTNDLRKTHFDVISYKTGLESIEARILVYQQNKTIFEEDIKLLKLDIQLRDNALVVLRQKFKKAEQERDELKLKLEKFQTSSKNLSQLLASQTNDKTRLGYDTQVFTSSMFDCNEMFSSESDISMLASHKYDRYQSGEGYHDVPPPYTGTFMPHKPDLVFHDAPNVNETVHTAFNVKLSPNKPDKDLSYTHRSSAPIIEDWLPILRQPFQSLKPMETAGIERHALSGNPHHALKDKGVIDNGCLRHMIGNMSYLTDFEKINGGYVAFGGNPKGGKILGKGKIKTGKLDFDDVYFVKELKFNLFSVSQICYKKNNVLFTDTECIVLSLEFKLPDENQVLLRVPRENNMYNVDLKNIVPFGDLTCLIAKETLNEVLVTKPHNKTPYELLLGRTPSIDFMRPFGCPVTIINTLDPLGSGPTWLFDIDTLTKSMNYQPVTAGNQSNPSADPQNADGDAAFEVKEPKFEGRKPESEVHVSPSSSAKTKKHDDKTKREAKGKSPIELSTRYGNLSAKFEDFSDNNINEVNAASTPVLTVGQISANSTNTYSAASPSNTVVTLEYITYSNDKEDVGAEADFSNLETTITVSPIPTTRVHKDYPVTQIIGDLSSATQTRSMTRMVKDQVDLPNEKRAIGTKWFFRNKKDKIDIVVRNKARLVAQGHTQEEGIDYEEVFALVTRIETIRLFLAYVSFMGFMVYQMDVKSDFLYGTIEEEVYVFQPSGFEDPDYPDKGKIDQTLFIKKQKGDILVVQVYVDDIIFGSTNNDLCKAFEKLMKDKFQMSSMGELTFFLGLQVKQKQDRIFINHDKYVAEILRKFGLTDGKLASTPIDTEKPLLKDPDGKDVDVHTYRSMIGSLMYLTSSRPDIMKKVIITEATVREALRLDGAERIDCFPNEEIFTELSRMRGHHGMSLALLWIQLSSAFQQQADVVNDEVVDVDDVPAADVEPTPPSPPPTTPPPPPPRELPSTSQVPTIISMDLLNNLLETCTALTRKVKNLEQDKIAQALKITKLKHRVRKLEKKKKLRVSGLKRLRKVGTTQMIESSTNTVMDDQEDASKQGEIIANIDADKDVTLKDVAAVAKEVEDDVKEPAELQEVIEVVTTAKLMIEVVTAATTTITAAAPIIVAPSAARRRKRVVIGDLEETATPSTIIHSEPKSKDKGKGILVEEPKPLKKQAQIEQDKAYARELEAKLNKNINWDDVIEQYFNSNVAFLEKNKEQLEEEESRALKRQRENEEVEELKKHLQIAPNDDDDDVYTEATPLTLKVPVADYGIYSENNKPFYKIIRADGSHQLFLSFQSLLRNFDKEDLEMLWQIVQERFVSSKPKNFFGDFLLTTLTYMFEKPDVEAQVLKNQRNVHALELMLLKTSKIYSKGLRLLVEDLMLLVQIGAVG